MSALGKAQDMWNPWHATLLVAEIAGMIAAVALMYQRDSSRRGGRRSKKKRASAGTATSSRSRSGGHEREKRKDGRKAPFTTDPSGHRKWQRYIEAQAMKKGISIAILLGWIDSPHQQDTTSAAGSTSEASQVIGVARRMSSLGLDKVNTKDQVKQAREALTSAEEEMRASEDSVTSGLIEAQRRLGEIYETKGGGDEHEAELRSAKEALERAKAAQIQMISDRGARLTKIAALRSSLESAILADSNAPADQASKPSVAASGTKDYKQVKDMLAPLQLANQSDLSKEAWQEIWPELTSRLQKQLWSRGLSQLYQIILSTLDDTQKTLITAANSDDQQDGLMAYKILRSHCYGSKEEWIARLWHTVQNWTQDRGARKELNRPRKLLDSLMMFEADLADFEETGETVSDRTKLIILKQGLARRQRPALEKIKNDLSGETWDYQRTVNWLLTWDREHQAEVKKGEAELMAAWRSGRRVSQANASRATANAATTARPKGKCYICGQSGHWARNCPKRANTNASASAALGGAGPGGRNTFRCFNCGQTGHAARDCPLPPQPRKCFICGSDKHLKKDCPQRDGAQGRQPQGGGRNARSNRPPPRRKAKPATARTAAAKTMNITRDNLKKLVKYVNTHKHSSNFTLSVDAAGAIGAVADNKPAPTSLVLIPMPVDTEAADEVAAILAENNSTLPILDSGASKSTVPMWYELCDERKANIDIQCAGEGQTMRCEEEGEDGLLGPAMKVQTNTPLLAIRPLDERGVGVLFMDQKVYALNASAMRNMIARAVENDHGREIGRSKPDWVYEMTDRRALEEVLRGADAGSNKVIKLKRTTPDPRPPRKLAPTGDKNFRDLGFDPTVYPDESMAERARQWRNAVRRMKAAERDRPLAIASDGDVSDVQEVEETDDDATESDDMAAAARTAAPRQHAKRPGNVDVQKHDCGRCGQTTFKSSTCAFCDEDDGGTNKTEDTWIQVPETPPYDRSVHNATSSRTRGVVAGSPLARSLGGAMNSAVAVAKVILIHPEPKGKKRRGKKRKCKTCGVIHYPGRCPPKPPPTPKDGTAQVPKQDEDARAYSRAMALLFDGWTPTGNPLGDRLKNDKGEVMTVHPRAVGYYLRDMIIAGCSNSPRHSNAAINRLLLAGHAHKPQNFLQSRKRKRHGKPDKPRRPMCSCIGCRKLCHWNVASQTYSDKCSMICRNGNCNHEAPGAVPLTGRELPRGGPQSKAQPEKSKGGSPAPKDGSKAASGKPDEWTENAAKQKDTLALVQHVLLSHDKAFLPYSTKALHSMTVQELRDREKAERSQHRLRLAVVMVELVITIQYWMILRARRVTQSMGWKTGDPAAKRERERLDDNILRLKRATTKTSAIEKARRTYHERVVYRMLARRMHNIQVTAVQMVADAKRQADQELNKVAVRELMTIQQRFTFYKRIKKRIASSKARKRAQSAVAGDDESKAQSKTKEPKKRRTFYEPTRIPTPIKGSWTREKSLDVLRKSNKFLERQHSAARTAFMLLGRFGRSMTLLELQRRVIKLTFGTRGDAEDRHWVGMAVKEVYYKFQSSRAYSTEAWKAMEGKALTYAQDEAAKSLVALAKATPGGVKTGVKTPAKAAAAVRGPPHTAPKPSAGSAVVGGTSKARP